LIDNVRAWPDEREVLRNSFAAYSYATHGNLQRLAADLSHAHPLRHLQRQFLNRVGPEGKLWWEIVPGDPEVLSFADVRLLVEEAEQGPGRKMPLSGF